MWSPVAKANLALAMIETEYLKGELWAEINYEKFASIPQGGTLPCSGRTILGTEARQTDAAGGRVKPSGKFVLTIRKKL